MQLSNHRTEFYRVWNYPAIGLIALPFAIYEGVRLFNGQYVIGTFTIATGVSLYAAISFLKKPWFTKKVYQIINYQLHDDGSEILEYVNDEMESSKKIRVSKKGIEEI